jgi:hypothetical protein
VGVAFDGEETIFSTVGRSWYSRRVGVIKEKIARGRKKSFIHQIL